MDEKEKLEKQKEIFEELMDKSDEELIMMINSGVFNKIIEGYGAKAMEFAGFEKEDVQKVKAIFPYVFDSVLADEAMEIGKEQ
ncbi:MAG: hypothetical protein PHI94_05370 [Eubacteriaceae bacterium]|nr:hypothetical protein [Eubacteriaceae bacterium]